LLFSNVNAKAVRTEISTTFGGGALRVFTAFTAA